LAPIIHASDLSQLFVLMCDASNYAIGVVLSQQFDKQSHAIYYTSRTLNDAQLNYSTIEKELLVVVFELEKFIYYLIGSPIIIHTYHSALRHLLARKDAKAPLIRWILVLQKFDL